MVNYQFSKRDRILAIPIALIVVYLFFNLVDNRAVVIPGGVLAMAILTIPVYLFVFSTFIKRARIVHKVALVLLVLSLYIHPEMADGYAKGWCEGSDYFTSKGIETEISGESVLRGEIKKASTERERSYWTNRLIQHLYVNDLWIKQGNRFKYIFYPLSVALFLLAIFIVFLSPSGDALILEVLNPYGNKSEQKNK